MHVDVPRGLTVELADDIVEEVTKAVAALTAGPNFVTVHLAPSDWLSCAATAPDRCARRDPAPSRAQVSP